GAWVIDVGISRADAGIVGDVDFAAVESVAAAITPMPGGTGPMTVACLVENTLTAWRRQHARTRFHVLTADAARLTGCRHHNVGLSTHLG
ncbi:MAG: hypothetical protein EBY86_01905, partial [Acidimicrobiia bacterium]|nr:hypothetical protein [Acidimicrobiia bacterium]